MHNGIDFKFLNASTEIEFRFILEVVIYIFDTFEITIELLELLTFALFFQVSRHQWTEGDRNMSEFFIYAMANFSWYG